MKKSCYHFFTLIAAVCSVFLFLCFARAAVTGGLQAIASVTAEPPSQEATPAPETLTPCERTGNHRYEACRSLKNGRHTATCSVCADRRTEDCVYTVTIVRPTQTAAGYTLHTCEKCGYSYTDGECPPESEHTESTLMGDVDADGAIAAADARRIIRACVSLSDIPPASLPCADMDGDGALTAEDARIALRCCVGLEAPAARHAYKARVLTATSCTKPGRISYVCAYCGDSGTCVYPAPGHKYKEIKHVSPTCETPGSSKKKCTVCNAKEERVLPKTGHKWSAGPDDAAVTCEICRKYADGFAEFDNHTYYCIAGEKQYGWCAIGEEYYFFDRGTGVMIKNSVVDALRIDADGKAVKSAYSVEKIKTFIKAKSILASITEKTDSVNEKKLKAFHWVMSCPYRQYRGVGAAMKTPGFEMLFANDIFDRGNGCCGSTSFAFAFLAAEAGCKEVYVCDDGVSDGGHAWVTMEGNNRVYDVVFAKGKSFANNYDCSVSDYRRSQPRKTYIGG